MTTAAKKMKVDIYKSASASGKGLAVPAGTDLADFKFPSTLDPDYHKVTPGAQDAELDPAVRRAGMNVQNVLDQISSQGYGTFSAVITVKIGP